MFKRVFNNKQSPPACGGGKRAFNRGRLQLRYWFLFSMIVFTLVSFSEYSFADKPFEVGPDPLHENVELSTGTYSGSEPIFKMAMRELSTEEDDDIVVESGAKVYFWAPKVVLRPGVHIEQGASFKAGIPSFDVNFINLVDPADVTSGFFDTNPTNTEWNEFCEDEIDVLNHYFVDKDGRQLVSFKLKDAVNWSTPSGTADEHFDECLEWSSWKTGDTPSEPTYCHDDEPGTIDELFNASSYVADDVITIVYFKDMDPDYISSAAHPDGRDYPARVPHPWIALNQHRVDEVFDNGGDVDGNGLFDDDGDRKAVHEHEMGHIFNLYHTADERVTSNIDPSNIMSRKYDSSGPPPDYPTWSSNPCANPNNFNFDSTKAGDRSVGFWYEPHDGTNPTIGGDSNLDACNDFFSSWVEYLHSVEYDWSQVEVIYYSAKSYKELWD